MSKIIQLKVLGVVAWEMNHGLSRPAKSSQRKFAFSPIFISHRNLSNGTTTQPDQSL